MNVEFTPEQKQKKVFVLGATGFIGRALVSRLVSLGFQHIFCLYRRDRKKDRLYKDVDTRAITFLKGDISQVNLLSQGCDGAAIVVNCAAKADDWGSRQEFWKVNVETPKMILGMLDEQPAPSQLIELTSGSIYGFSPTPKNEHSPLQKSDRLYTASKIEAYRWLHSQMLMPHQAAITILAPPLVWGPGDQIYIPLFIDQLIHHRLVTIGRAEQPLDFVHIDDLLDGILRCFFNPQAYNAEFIINGPSPFPLKNLIEHIAEISGLPYPHRNAPIAAMMVYGLGSEWWARLINIFNSSYRPPITRFQVQLFSRAMNLNAERAKIELGYHPEIDYETGKESIREYVVLLSRWMKTRR